MHSSSFPFRSWHPTPGSGARSGEVRVSYFDPETGEPLAERKGAPRRPAEGVARRMPRGPGAPGRPVLVDGARYPSVSAAARAVGCAQPTLSEALRKGRKTCKGHAVAWAECREGAETAPSRPENGGIGAKRCRE